MSDKKMPLSVLLIEDNPGDRRLAELALKEAGLEAGMNCRVLTAGTLAEGLETLAADGGRIDAILLDLGLPDVKGFEGLFQLRDVVPDVPIIVLTGLSDQVVATDALKHGASDYLEKADVQPRMLWRAIRYAIERKKTEAELVQLANSDPLTGLLNRRAFFRVIDSSLEHARRSKLICAVIVFDIDHFKEINDSFGHHLGDQLLVKIAAEVKGRLRRTDTIGRLGGDEFAVIAPNLKSANDAIEIAEKIRASVCGITNLNGIELRTNISIGIAVFPEDNSSAEVLVSHADMAMYKSKGRGSGPINFYDVHMDRVVKARQAMKRSMLPDISDGKFRLHYQPIVDAETFNIVAAEGLARWHEPPDNKNVDPGQFIAIAEEAGWISELGRRLFEDACLQIKQTLDDGKPTVPISINISPLQCLDHGFALRLVGILMKHKIDPSFINVEITESTLIQNIDMARQNLVMLKNVGIGVHIDDFGTGYSSLSVLKDLPLDVLKVDRSFISEMARDIGSRQIVEAIAELSRKLQLKTIAEGVETEEQAKILRDIGIDYLQGYYFSRPVPIDDFRELLVLGAPLGGANEEDLSDRGLRRIA